MKKIKQNITLNDLAIMIGNGFDNVQNQFDGMKVEADAMNLEMKEIKNNVIELSDGQEQIRLRLDNVAHRFELQELDKRVSHLERKIGIRHR